MAQKVLSNCSFAMRAPRAHEEMHSELAVLTLGCTFTAWPHTGDLLPALRPKIQGTPRTARLILASDSDGGIPRGPSHGRSAFWRLEAFLVNSEFKVYRSSLQGR